MHNWDVRNKSVKWMLQATKLANVKQTIFVNAMLVIHKIKHVSKH